MTPQQRAELCSWLRRSSTESLAAACAERGIVVSCRPASRALTDDRWRMTRMGEGTETSPGPVVRRRLQDFLWGYHMAVAHGATATTERK